MSSLNGRALRARQSLCEQVGQARFSFNFALSDPNNSPTLSRQIDLLAFITRAVAMPIIPVHFQRDTQRGQQEVNTVPAHADLLAIGYPHDVKSLVSKLLQSGLSYGTTITRKATELARFTGADAHLNTTGTADYVARRAAALFATVMAIQMLFSHKNLAAALTSNVFGRGQSAGTTTDRVALSLRDENRKLLSAAGAGFCYFGRIGQLARLGAILLAALNARCLAIERRTAPFAGKHAACASSKMVAGRRTVDVSIRSRLEWLGAVGAGLVNHPLYYITSGAPMHYIGVP